MKTINYNAIQDEITENLGHLQSGIIDCYDFMHTLTRRYIEPVYPMAIYCEGENPYSDLLFSMFEINKVELY